MIFLKKVRNGKALRRDYPFETIIDPRALLRAPWVKGSSQLKTFPVQTRFVREIKPSDKPASPCIGIADIRRIRTIRKIFEVVFLGDTATGERIAITDELHAKK